MNNIGVSYPGAQGDRKILFGSGVTTKREYVDIISIQKISENECNLFLQENKKKISQTQNSDIDKLVNIRNSKEKMHKLNELISKIYMPIEIKCCYIGVGGKESHLSIGETRIDYLIYIMINENNNIDWKIFCSNQTIFQIFKNIADSDGTLKGEIELEYPMYIVE